MPFAVRVVVQSKAKASYKGKLLDAVALPSRPYTHEHSFFSVIRNDTPACVDGCPSFVLHERWFAFSSLFTWTRKGFRCAATAACA